MDESIESFLDNDGRSEGVAGLLWSWEKVVDCCSKRRVLDKWSSLVDRSEGLLRSCRNKWVSVNSFSLFR